MEEPRAGTPYVVPVAATDFADDVAADGETDFAEAGHGADDVLRKKVILLEIKIKIATQPISLA